MPAHKERSQTDDLKAILKALPRRYIKQTPTALQAAGLFATQRTILLGGAAGPGKSSWELMKALQFVEVPEFRSLILRRTFPQLAMSGGLMERAHEWLAGTGAKWKADFRQWRFPSGAVMQFGHMEHIGNIDNYSGHEYHTICIDESTAFLERMIRSLYRCQRQSIESKLPIQMCLGSNPGGVSHDFHKQVFRIGDDAADLEGDDVELFADAIFIPGKLEDNPHINQEGYRKSLMHLDPITRRRLLGGDWSARDTGGFFLREWFKIVDAYPADASGLIAYWDQSASEKKNADWTAGALMLIHEGRIYVLDVKRKRGTPRQVDDFMKATTDEWANKHKALTVGWEQEPGSSGAKVTAYLRRLFAGYPQIVDVKRVKKAVRAGAVSSQAEEGNVYFLNGPWITDCLDEHEVFTGEDVAGQKDDQVDAISGGYAMLTKGGGVMEYYRRLAEKRANAQGSSR